MQAEAPAAPSTAPASAPLGRIEQLRRAGFNDQEVNDWSTQKGSTLLAAGFSQSEVNDYMGIKAPKTAPVRQMVQQNLSQPESQTESPTSPAEGKEPSQPASFPQSLDQGMGMPVASMIKGSDAHFSPQMRAHLMDAYAGGHARDASDFMQSAIPAAAQATWYQKLWHATEAFGKGFADTMEDQAPLDQDTVNTIMGPQSLKNEMSVADMVNKPVMQGTVIPAAKTLYHATAYDAAVAVMGVAQMGKSLLTMPAAAFQGFEDFSKKLGQETGHPEIGKAVGTAPQALMEAFPEMMMGDRPAGAGPSSFDAAMASRHVGARLSSIVHGGNDLRKMVGETIGKPAESVTSQDVANTIGTAFKKKAPSAEDFINTAIVMLGPEKKEVAAATLRDTYKETGVPPAQVFVDAKVNPSVAVDIEAGKVPEAYEALKEPEAEKPEVKNSWIKSDANENEVRVEIGKKQTRYAGGEGAVSYTVRKNGEDSNPLIMVVSKDGKLVQGREAINLDGTDSEIVWKEGTEAQKTKVVELLKRRSQTKLGSPERGEIDAHIEKIVKGSKPVDHDLHIPDEFREHAKQYTSDERGTNEAMRDFLLQKGRDTGHEHLVIQDVNTGNVVIHHTTGEKSHVGFTKDIQKELENPNNSFHAHHNHPRETPVSIGDVAGLSLPGTRTITAHAENGAFSQAALTDSFRSFAHDKSIEDVYRMLREIGDDAWQQAKREISPLFKEGKIDKTLANKAVPEMANRALAKAGIIDYTSSHNISGIAQEILAPLEERLTQAVAAEFKKHGFDGASISGRISVPDETRFGKEFAADQGGTSPHPEKNAIGGDISRGKEVAGTEPGRQSLNLSPEHQEFENLLGIPEGMNPSQLGKVESKLESIFADSGKNDLPKASDLTDEQFSALEQYGRRVEEAKAAQTNPRESGSIPFAPEMRPEIKKFFSDIKRDILNFATPMETGSDAARASAKDFINSIRKGQWNSTRLFHYLTDNFTPEELKRMWEAMDEASVHVQTQEANGLSREAAMADAEKNAVGHFGLPEEQQKIITAMSKWAQASWDAAKKEGMVEGEGLPFWTPRMAAVIGEGGKWEAPGGVREGSKPTLNPVGRNLRTSAGSLKGRKYLTAEETETAMKSLFGEDATKLVRDIRAMPIALQRLNQAIAGRTLINDIKEFGTKTGTEVISGEAKDGFFTMDHPAFQTYRPKLEMGEDGKWSIAKDAHGDDIFEKVPIYISKEFEGPLKAVLSQPSGAAYKALMSMKGKSMSMIMFSPLIHNLVEYGRALPAVPGKVWNTKIYFEGNAAKKDPVFMQRMIDHGMDPIGSRFFNQDLSSMMEEPNLTPGRSWTAKLLGGLTTDAVGEKAGLKVKAAFDKMGDVWHNTLLWDRVAELQVGIAHNIEQDMIKKGFQPEAAATAAAHLANRYAGALPMESMGPLSRKMANLLMFSRSFTIGNLGVMKDMLVGLPADAKAQLIRDIGAEGAEAASSFVKRKSRAAFMMDIGLKVAGISIMQDVIDHLKNDKSLGDILHGYVDRFDRLIKSHQEDPWALLNLLSDAEALSSTATNEPGKQDRVLMSKDPDTGTASYMRLPTGKIGEEFEGWLTSPLEMMRRKQSTMVSPLVDLYKNEDYFGHPIYDKEAKGFSGAGESLGKAALHILKAQYPENFVDSVYKFLTGTEREDNAQKSALAFLGLTMSKGYPGGPEAGILAAATRRHEALISESLPKIKKAIEADDTEKARQIMEELGMTNRQQTAYIKHYKNPQSKVNARSLKTFERIATPEEKELLEQQESKEQE